MNTSRKFTLFLGDCVVLLASLFIMLAIDQGGVPSYELFWIHVGPFSIIFILWVLVFYVLDLYEIKFIKASPLTLGRLAISFVIAFSLGAILFYTVPIFGITPKLNLVIFTVISFFLTASWRRLFARLFAKSFIRKIAIICETPETTLLANEIALHPYIGTCVGFFENIKDIPKKGVDMVVVAAEPSNELVSGTSYLNKEIIRVREAYEEIFGKTPLTLMNNETALGIIEKNKFKTSDIFSRILEIFFAFSVLLISSPFLIVSIILISIEDGFPVFYKQVRVGKGGKIFHIHKLRTMRKDAEKSGAQWAEKSDPRVTRIGRILRKLHIDEIPQMLNIIKGDIALVGPRPERPEFVQELEKTIPYYFLRHTIKPGFTGWAQIKYRYARSVLDSKEKFEYDLFYLKRKNFLLDLGIIAKTVQIIFTH